MEFAETLNFLACPACRNDVTQRDEILSCSNSSCNYFTGFHTLKSGKFVLVDFGSSLLDKDRVLNSEAQSVVSRMHSNLITDLGRIVLNGYGKKSRDNVNYIADCIENANFVPKILIIGGGKVGVGIDRLYNTFGDRICCFDIYNSDNVDFIADAHSLPFQNDTFDIIIIQAVLEHVYDPVIVVQEIYRCLKNDGIVYSETPFMQHVHEGAYDFTRYTVLGHRILFKGFHEIDSGYIGGVGLTLLWSLEYFFTALFRSRKVGKFFKLGLFWVRFFDYFVPDRYNFDSACGCYFLGKKDLEINEVLILKGYKGAQ